jgi:hypothetical protein
VLGEQADVPAKLPPIVAFVERHAFIWTTLKSDLAVRDQLGLGDDHTFH